MARNLRLENPFASVVDRLEDAFTKGFISRSNADLLIETHRFVVENMEAIKRQVGDRNVEVAVVAVPEREPKANDREVSQEGDTEAGLPGEGRFAFYTGDDATEAESRAIQFSPGVPFVVFSLGEPELLTEIAERF